MIFYNCFDIQLLLLLVASISYSNAQSTCLVLVNNKLHDANKNLVLNDQNYHLAFGSTADRITNTIVGYSIDVNCNLNNTFKSHFYYDIKYLPIEINVLNCSKDLSFKNIALFNNGSIDFFILETKLSQSNITDLNVNLTINRRYGNGCTSSLYFTKNMSLNDHIIGRLQDLWQSIKTNYLCFLILVILAVTLLILTILSVSHISKYIICEKKHIEINVPTIRFIKSSKNVKFDSLSHLTENNNPSIAENLEPNQPEISNDSKVDESVQADLYNQFHIIREQFNSKDPNRDSSKRNAAFQQ